MKRSIDEDEDGLVYREIVKWAKGDFRRCHPEWKGVLEFEKGDFDYRADLTGTLTESQTLTLSHLLAVLNDYHKDERGERVGNWGDYHADQ